MKSMKRYESELDNDDGKEKDDKMLRVVVVPVWTDDNDQ